MKIQGSISSVGIRPVEGIMSYHHSYRLLRRRLLHKHLIENHAFDFFHKCLNTNAPQFGDRLTLTGPGRLKWNFWLGYFRLSLECLDFDRKIFDPKVFE